MNDQRNLMLFVLIFIAVLGGWHYLYEGPQIDAQKQQEVDQVVDRPLDIGMPSEIETAANGQLDRPAALAATQRCAFATEKLKGSINLKGAKIDDLTLIQYRQETDPESSNIILLSPQQTSTPYHAEFGWGTADKSIAVPNSETVWSTNGSDCLGQPLSWDNGQDLVFKQTYTLDDEYMFNVKSTVTNNGSEAVTLYPYARINRSETPQTSGFFILHEGPLGFIDDKLEEIDYEDLQEKKDIRIASQGGWIGITDKYWLTALLPTQSDDFEFFFRDLKIGAQDNYQTGYYGKPVKIAPGQSLEVQHNFFAGAKELALLDSYEEKLGVKHFDLAVDFGWFYFITKPIFHLLTFLHAFLGNFGLGILLLTVGLKLLFLPLANKSYRSMARMKKLQPKMEQLKERYADDKMQLNQAMMDLYKKEKVNPAAGCLPILIQIPVFFALYKVLFVSIEMRHAPFYGWIHDLSAPDPTTIFNFFGLIPWDPPSFLMIGAWPLIMGLSMFVQQKLNPTPTDPVQAKMFMIMPVVLTIMLSNFPAGLVIYWAWNNILSIGQQWLIMRMAAEEKPKKKK